jgi:magnesium chelatase subunit D
MAERCEPRMAARLGQALDAGRHCVVALDEGVEDEVPPPALTDRLGLFLAPDTVSSARRVDVAPNAARIARVGATATGDDAAVRQLVGAAGALGVAGLRAPAVATRVARISATLAGRSAVAEADLACAAELCLAHRATVLPGEQDAGAPPPDDGDPPSEDDGGGTEGERVVDAARAVLPPEVLASLAAGRSRTARGAGAGAARAGGLRGRPLPSRPGRLDGRARIDLVATLAAAAPWQALRGTAAGGIRVLPGDVRVRRYRERAERLLIFAVDASGSAAAARLAEAKGAVELMLAGAYAKRDRVALIAFRGTGAEIVLPPTRSLSLAKRRLAGLPGGGGTPLAAGLGGVLDLSRQTAKRGLTPALVLLTDGRANVALDGTGGRPQAQAEALAMARRLGADGVRGVVLDTGRRPDPWLADLAAAMGARYVPLPRADAAAVAATLATALPR